MSIHLKLEKLLLVIITLIAGFISGCRDKSVIWVKVAISPDGEKLAFCAGAKSTKGKWPDPRMSHIYVLDLLDFTSQQIKFPRSTLTLEGVTAWRPGTEPDELFVAASLIDEPNRPYLLPYGLFCIKTTKPASVTYCCDLTEDRLDPVFGLGWSPDGRILAVARLTGLYLSYDNALSFVRVPISVMGTDDCVWIGNEVLYVRDGHNIIEVDIRDGQPSSRTFVEGGKRLTRLCGTLNGKVVYRLDNDVYRGDKLLFHSDQKLWWVLADGDFAVIQIASSEESDSRVVVLDGEGNVKHQKNVGNNSFLIALSAESKFVYLLKDLRWIQRYRFVDSDEISTIYKLPN
jgi:hypothetical protein